MGIGENAANINVVGEELAAAHIEADMLNKSARKVAEARADELDRLRSDNSKLFRIEESNTYRELQDVKRMPHLLDPR